MTVEEQLAVRLGQQARDRAKLGNESKASRLIRDHEIKIRVCMTCGNRFVSEGVGNRLCPKHKHDHKQKRKYKGKS
jgi:hypothetical protein